MVTMKISIYKCTLSITALFEARKSNPVELSLLAPIYNCVNSMAKIQEMRYYLLCKENCLSYAVERLRTSGLRLPEPKSETPNSYIQMMNKDYVFTKDAQTGLTVASRSGELNIKRAISLERIRTVVQHQIDLEFHTNTRNLSIEDSIGIPIPSPQPEENRINDWIFRRSNFKPTGRTWGPPECNDCLAQQFQNHPYEESTTNHQPPTGIRQSTRSPSTNRSPEISRTETQEDPDLRLLASFLPLRMSDDARNSASIQAWMKDNKNELKSITKLILFRNHEPFKSLPPQISMFSELEHLEFVNTGPVRTLTPEICKLVNLKTLNLSGIGLLALPLKCRKLKNLEERQLMGNNLSVISPDICKLKKLEELGFRRNKLEIVPEEIGDLANLKTLNLSYNNIKKLPLTICNLKNLMHLDVSGNPCSVPNEIIKFGAKIKEKGGIFTMDPTSWQVVTKEICLIQ